MSRTILKNSQVLITSPYEIDNKICSVRGILGTDLEDKEQNDSTIENMKEYTQTLIDIAKEEVETILAESHLEASKIITDAKKTAEIIKEEAKSKGYLEGYEKGELESKKEYDTWILDARSLAQKAAADYELTLREAQNEIASLAVAVAKKVIGEEIKVNAEVIISIVREILSKTLEKKGIILEVSSNDYQIVKNNIDVIATKEFGISQIEIKENHGLNNGDVLVNTAFGTLNGTVEAKIGKINDAFNKLQLQEDDKKLD